MQCFTVDVESRMMFAVTTATIQRGSIMFSFIFCLKYNVRVFILNMDKVKKKKRLTQASNCSGYCSE